MQRFFQVLLALCLVGLLSNCAGSGSLASTTNALPPGTSSFLVTAPNAPTSYLINSVMNASLTLQRGMTYAFNVSTPSHPFYIMTVKGTDTSNAYNTGVTNNGASIGTVTFTVPAGAPNTLYYNCLNHLPMGGTISIIN
jgi:hypothetical protein